MEHHAPHAPESALALSSFDPEAEAISATPATEAELTSRPAPAWKRGWTPEAQRLFLEMIAEGYTVESGCMAVGLSAQSAYAFRRRANGASFSLGWQAASLIARNKLSDTLVSRVFDGQTETIIRADGSEITRHRFDNRLAMSVLTRLDRLADEQVNEGTHHAARLVAQEFDQYLDMIEADAGPARAGLFLAARCTDPDEPAADLNPIVALARADRYKRGRAGLAVEIETGDLDPVQREGWSAEQWSRAEAAGLVAVAKPFDETEEEEKQAAFEALVEEKVRERLETEIEARLNAKVEKALSSHQLSQLEEDDEADEDEDIFGDSPVWRNEHGEWLTNFPPPPDFDGWEDNEFGEPDYVRECIEEEIRMACEHFGFPVPPTLEEAEDARDSWFKPQVRPRLAGAGIDDGECAAKDRGGLPGRDQPHHDCGSPSEDQGQAISSSYPESGPGLT